MSILKNINHKLDQYHVVYHKDPSLVLCFSYCSLMTYLPKCCTNGKVRLFADDTTIFFHTNSIDDVISTGKTIMTQLTNWFTANRLTLNADKSSFTLFKSSKKVIPNVPEHINFFN